MRECIQLTVSADIKEPARRVVRAGGESISVREEANSEVSTTRKKPAENQPYLTALISDSWPVKV